MKVVILYEELAPYFIVSVGRFVTKYNAEVVLIRKAVNDVAPFNFDLTRGIQVVERETLQGEDLISFVREQKPDAIFCGGWAYKPYMNVCLKFRASVPVVLGLDNWWMGTWKQRLATVVAKRFFRKRFSGCFVPGRRQEKFARKLGFGPAQIRTGAYSCDFNLYDGLFKKYRAIKEKHFPRKFIYVGRYVEEKGVSNLWNAFIRLVEETGTAWQLVCIGKGPVSPVEHPQIRHVGFVQPENMESFIAESGVFILPSNFEPWGVAVHEFAAAGFPLLLSDKVGAAEIFLAEKENGFSFGAGDEDALLHGMKQFVKMTDADLSGFGVRSNQLASQITNDSWADNFHSLLSGS